MFPSFTEWHGESVCGEKRGTVGYNTHYYTRRKPAWLVGLKLLGLAAMVAVGFAIALPSLQGRLELWQSVALVAGVMFIYTGVAFFIRPEPNGDNMGWLGGLSNDPTQYSDNINRFLWNLHCTLGPGRFAAETLLDACVLVGLASGEEVDPGYDGADESTIVPSQSETIAAEDMGSPALSPNRFHRR